MAGRWRAKNCQRQRPRTSANGAKKVTKMRCAKGGPAPRAVCLALRAQSHRWNYCVERLPSLLTRHAEGCPQLRVAPQGRLITGTASSRRRGRRVHMQPDTVQHAAQSYCQVRGLSFCSRRGPQESSPCLSGSVSLARSLLPACDAGLSSTLPVGMALVSAGAPLATWPTGRPPPARQALWWASQPALPGKPRKAMEENAQLNSKLNNFKEFNEKSKKLSKIVEFAVELRVFLHCLVATAWGW